MAHALDDLGVHLIEAGFPSSNPKEEAVFDLLSREHFENAEIAAFGMTRRRDTTADQDPALRLLADAFTPVTTLVGKTWRLHLEKVTRVDPDENLRMIADSVAFLRARGQARGVRRRALLRRLPRGPGLRAEVPEGGNRGRCRDRRPVRHQRLEPPRPDRRRDGERRHGTGRARHHRHPHPRRRRLRRRERDRRRRGRRAARPGHRERLRRALRQRQPRHDRPRAPAQARLRLPPRGHDALPHRDGAHDRRDRQRQPQPEPALRRQERVRAQGRDARRRNPRRRPHVRAHRPRARWQRPRAADLGALRQGHRAVARIGIRPAPGRADRDPRGRAGEEARARGLPVRGRRRLVRPPDPQGQRRLGTAVHARGLARAGREARGRQGPDRGHHQDLGEGRALPAHGRGQRPGARARRRAQKRDRGDVSASERHRAGELQGPHPRREEGHRRRDAGAA